MLKGRKMPSRRKLQKSAEKCSLAATTITSGRRPNYGSPSIAKARSLRVPNPGLLIIVRTSLKPPPKVIAAGLTIEGLYVIQQAFQYSSERCRDRHR
jgi:hypothetical protein